MSRITPADLDSCAQEPLRWSGRIQDVGALLVARAGRLTHVSANASRWFRLPAGDDVQLDELFRDVTSFFERRAEPLLRGSHWVVRGVVTNEGARGDVVWSRRGADDFYAFEPEAEPHRAVGPVGCAATAGDWPVDWVEVLGRLHALSGFPKVMVYRFLHDDSGEVLAELSTGQLEPYLGLRFPASDIPANARALYLEAPFRLIPDRDRGTCEVRPLRPGFGPVDLGSTNLRSVSPVHLEYLANMGVAASASFAIAQLGKLWGLVAFHSPEPRTISIEGRLAIRRLLDSAVARELLKRRLEVQHRRFTATGRTLEALAARLARAMVGEPFSGMNEVEADLVPNDGMAVLIDGVPVWMSHPDLEPHWPALAALGQTEAPVGQFATSAVGDLLAQGEAFRQRVSGLLSEAAGRGAVDGVPALQLLWVRREQRAEVVWAGRPAKRRREHQGQVQISPRTSFQAWAELSEGSSEPWSHADRQVASRLLGEVLRARRG